jgi:hypothetical protein
MMITKVGPRITLAEQVAARKAGGAAKHDFRGKQLALRLTSPAGHELRAADLFPLKNAGCEELSLGIELLGAKVDHYYALLRRGRAAKMPVVSNLGQVMTENSRLFPEQHFSDLVLDPQNTHPWAKALLEICEGRSADSGDHIIESERHHMVAEVLSRQLDLRQDLVAFGRIVSGQIELFDGDAARGCTGWREPYDGLAAALSPAIDRRSPYLYLFRLSKSGR